MKKKATKPKQHSMSTIYKPEKNDGKKNVKIRSEKTLNSIDSVAFRNVCLFFCDLHANCLSANRQYDLNAKQL